MIKIAGLGTDLGYYWFIGDLLGLKFNKMNKKYAMFAISDDFQHLASIEHSRIPKNIEIECRFCQGLLYIINIVLVFSCALYLPSVGSCQKMQKKIYFRSILAQMKVIKKK